MQTLHFLPRSPVVHSLLFRQSRVFFFSRISKRIATTIGVLFSFSRYRTVIRCKKRITRAHAVRNSMFLRMVNRNVLRYESCWHNCKQRRQTATWYCGRIVSGRFRVSPELIKLNKFALNDASFMAFCLIYHGVRFHLYLDGVTSI